MDFGLLEAEPGGRADRKETARLRRRLCHAKVASVIPPPLVRLLRVLEHPRSKAKVKRLTQRSHFRIRRPCLGESINTGRVYRFCMAHAELRDLLEDRSTQSARHRGQAPTKSLPVQAADASRMEMGPRV